MAAKLTGEGLLQMRCGPGFSWRQLVCGLCDERVLVLGHTHPAMGRESRPGRLIVNLGSVGKPRDRRPVAAYPILDPDHGSVLHRRASKDVERYQQWLRGAGVKEDMVTLLSRTAAPALLVR